MKRTIHKEAKRISHVEEGDVCYKLSANEERGVVQGEDERFEEVR